MNTIFPSSFSFSYYFFIFLCLTERIHFTRVTPHFPLRCLLLYLSLSSSLYEEEFHLRYIIFITVFISFSSSLPFLWSVISAFVSVSLLARSVCIWRKEHNILRDLQRLASPRVIHSFIYISTPMLCLCLLEQTFPLRDLFICSIFFLFVLCF